VSVYVDIDVHRKRSQVLAMVARALVARGDTSQAHHAASAACAVGQWTIVLEG
jgi:hypothetical protein